MEMIDRPLQSLKSKPLVILQIQIPATPNQPLPIQTKEEPKESGKVPSDLSKSLANTLNQENYWQSNFM